MFLRSAHMYNNCRNVYEKKNQEKHKELKYLLTIKNVQDDVYFSPSCIEYLCLQLLSLLHKRKKEENGLNKTFKIEKRHFEGCKWNRLIYIHMISLGTNCYISRILGASKKKKKITKIKRNERESHAAE